MFHLWYGIPHLQARESRLVHLIWISNYVHMETLAGAQVGLTGHISHHVSLAILIQTPCRDEMGQLVQHHGTFWHNIFEKKVVIFGICGVNIRDSIKRGPLGRVIRQKFGA